jgi:accessory colonization factor AcfC
MYGQSVKTFHSVALFVMSVSMLGTAVFAQDVLHVYGTEGPSPAVNEAAVAFGDDNDITVEVVSGSINEWLGQAKDNADVVFSSAEHVMSEFMHAEELRIEEGSITPLYLRPAAILVRPGNPKQIHDFPDLLRPGIRIMVVTGCGQTGLWEDMAGKQGDIRTVRALRDNIVVFASDSKTAVKNWREREDIDAWVTWNIWYMPLHDHADLIHVGEEHRIYRQCSAALTERGRRNPLAERFIKFLTSPEGARIFQSWDWMAPPTNPNPLTVCKDIAIVGRIDSDTWEGDFGAGLVHIQQLAEDYRAMGEPICEVHIDVVVHDDAAYWMLDDEAYARFTKRDAANPNKEIIRKLREHGVSIEVCGQTLAKHGWTREDILPGVRIVPSAHPRIADLQLQGYAYLRF